MDALWAAWRSAYVMAPESEERCLFCRLPAEPDEAALIVARGRLAYTVLNRYPYTTGHVMVAPHRHIANPSEATPEERLEMWELLAAAEDAIAEVMRPDGFNLGANLGRVAGAGIPGHLHLHLVPRWQGDTNFLTAVGYTRVIPQVLEDTWQSLRNALDRP